MNLDPLSTLSVSRSAGKEDPTFHRFIKHFDWLLFLDVLALCAVGMLTIYSATLQKGRPELYMGKQTAAFLIGLFLLFVLAVLNYQIFEEYPRVIFLISMFLLILVLVAGKTTRGTRAWFMVGGFSFQPAEISKLLATLAVAAWCSRKDFGLDKVKSFMAPFLIVLAHIVLILMQPDFGSTLVYFPILLAMLFAAGASSLYLLPILFFMFVSASFLLTRIFLSLDPVLILKSVFYGFVYKGMGVGKEFIWIQSVFAAFFFFVWWVLKNLRFRIPALYFVMGFVIIFSGALTASEIFDHMKIYQRKRLMVFFSPQLDPSGAGYHVIQSMVALGSGKIFGKGLFSGTQGRLGFLPEQHTDFIFSVLGEELGFIFSSLVLFLYLYLVWRSISIALNSRDRFGSLVALGIGSTFAFYAILNLAMVMGMAPVAGLPLPLMSYGGSSLVSSLASIGILLSIHVRRFTY